jgi:circadian clock protein KaiC
MPLGPLAESGRMEIHPVHSADTSPGHFAHLVREAVERRHARIVVIDSLNGYLYSMPDEHLLVAQMHELLAYLGQHGVLTLLVVAQAGIIGSGMTSPVDVTYLADTVVLLRYFEAAGSVRQAMSVVKRRSGQHERTIRELRIGVDGVRVGEPLHEFQGVLSGLPQYSGTTGVASLLLQKRGHDRRPD